MKTSLDLLNAIQIPKPCAANWADMIGDDYARYCGICEKHVYNLSALSAGDAAALFLEKEGQICVRLYRRLDGTVMTADCHKPTGSIAKTVASVAALAGSLLMAGCSNAPDQESTQTQSNVKPNTPDTHMVMGEACVPLAGSPAPMHLPAQSELLDIPPREVLVGELPAKNTLDSRDQK